MKLKNTLTNSAGQIKNKVKWAALLALVGAWLSLLVCTILGASGVIKGFLPIWLFALFFALDLLLNLLPQTAGKKWIKPVVLVGAAAVIVLILRLIG